MAQAAINTRQVDPYEAWAAAYRALSARQQWEAMRPGRRIVIDSARLSGHAWRRVSDGHPCAFCAMLVTRGPAYWSMETAQFRAHRYCGCTAEEFFGDPNGWQPTDLEQQFIDLYEQAHQPGMDENETTAAMRAQGQGVVNDAHAPQTQTGGTGGKPPPPVPPILMGGAEDWPEWLQPVSQERWSHILEEHGSDSTSGKPKFSRDTDIATAIFDAVTRGDWDYDGPDGKVKILTVNMQSIVVVMRPTEDGYEFFIVSGHPDE